MKKAVLLMLAVIMCVALVGCGEGSGTITTTIAELTESGGLILTADVDDLEDEGIIPGNEVIIEVGAEKMAVLYNKDILEGEGIEQIYANPASEKVEIFIYEGSFAEKYQLKTGDTITLTKVIQPAA